MELPPPHWHITGVPFFHPWRRQARAFRQLHSGVWTYLKLFHGLQVVGADRVPQEGAILLAGNHPSLMDPVTLVAAAPRRIAFLSAEWTFSYPVLRRIMKGTGMIMVDRTKEGGGAPALRQALKLLQQGWAIGIYPHGKLVNDDESVAVKTGLVQMAIMSGARVVPVRTIGTDKAMPKGKKTDRLFVPIKLIFGDPITVELDRKALRDESAMQVEAERIQSAIMALE